MEYKFVIHGRLAGLNEYTAANRTNPYKGASMKRTSQLFVYAAIKKQLNGLHITKPVKMHYRFYEKDKRRDLDNVESFAKKVIQDALVEAKVLKDDGWNEIISNSSEFYVDKQNPRIEVCLEVV